MTKSKLFYNATFTENGVYIIGAGGHSKQVIDCFKHSKIPIKGIFDDDKTGMYYHDYQIIGKVSDIDKLLDKTENLFCGIGDNKIRQIIIEHYKDYNFLNCIHPLAHISDSAKMGIGNYIGPYSILDADSVVGNFNIINNLSIIAHDVQIGNFNHIAPHACLGGSAKIKDNILVGSNATILPKIIIESDVIVGAGSLVHKNINNKCTVVGNPFRIIK